MQWVQGCGMMGAGLCRVFAYRQWQDTAGTDDDLPLFTGHDELLVSVVWEKQHKEGGRCTCLLCQVAPSPSCLATSSTPHASSRAWAGVTPMCWPSTGDCCVRRSR